MEFKTMSTQELKALWPKQSDEPFPANRSSGSPLNSFYPIDDYIVLFDGENIVGGIGFGKKDGFTIRGGAFISPKYRKQNLYNSISAEADKLPTPFIAGFSSSIVSNKEWIESNKNRGWDISPTDKELGEYADNPTVKAFKEYYDNHPRGAKWAVKGLPLSKMWWKVMLR